MPRKSDELKRVTQVTLCVTPNPRVLCVVPIQAEYQLRKKHYCNICGNRSQDVGIKRDMLYSVHQSNPLSPSLAFQDVKLSKVSRFKSHTSNYYSRYSNFPSPQLERKNPLIFHWKFFAKSLNSKRLKEDLMFTPTRQPLYKLNGHIPEAINTDGFAPQFAFQDLAIIGYMGYVCQHCLIAHSGYK